MGRYEGLGGRESEVRSTGPDQVSGTEKGGAFVKDRREQGLRRVDEKVRNEFTTEKSHRIRQWWAGSGVWKKRRCG